MKSPDVIDEIEPESVKFKLQNKVERLISTAFSAKILMLEFAPNGCRKSYMIQCLKHLISCGFQAFLFNQVSRIQVEKKLPAEMRPCRYCGGRAREYAYPDRNYRGDYGFVGKVRCTECGVSVEAFGYDIRSALVMAKSYWCRGICDV